MDSSQRQLRDSYDRVARQYAEKFFDELDRKPFDRELLNRFARMTGGRGPVCDLGCGPGQIARYLHDRGAEVLGIDLSPEMVAAASRLSPFVRFRQGDMIALDAPDGVWAGIAAFYSIIHIPRRDVPAALREVHRVLRRGGLLLLAFHGGSDIIHLDEWWEQDVCIDFIFFQREEMVGYLTEAGFLVEEMHQRPPYKSEYQSQRIYILARKPGGVER